MMKRVLFALAVIALIAPSNLAFGDLTAYWSFDTSYANSTSATGGTAMDGTGIGNVSIDSSAAKFGIGGLKIDDTNNTTKHCVLINSAIADWTSNPTVCVMGWYQWNDLSDDGSDARRYIWETGTTTGGDYIVSSQINTSTGYVDQQRWANYTTGGNFNDFTGPTIIEGEWNHMAWVHNTAAHTVKYYHNGELRDYRAVPTKYQTLRTNADAFFIGSARSTYTDRNFDGYMDEVAVFSHEVTGEVVSGIVNGTYTPDTAPTNVESLRSIRVRETSWALVGTILTDDPTGVAVGTDGTVYAARLNYESTDGGAYQLDGGPTLLGTGEMTADLAVDADNDLFYTEGSTIQRTAFGSTSDWVTGLSNADAVAIVSDTFTGGGLAGQGLVLDDSGVSVWSPDASGAATLLADGTALVDAQDIAVSDSAIFLADTGADKIYTVDPTTGALTELTTSEAIDNPISLVVDPNSGDLFVMADSDIAPTKVVRVNTTTGAVSTVVDTLLDGYEDIDDGGDWRAMSNLSKLAMSDDGKYLYIAEQDGGAVYKLQAVPEPSVIALLLAGMLGLIGLRGRK